MQYSVDCVNYLLLIFIDECMEMLNEKIIIILGWTLIKDKSIEICIVKIYVNIGVLYSRVTVS